MPTGKLNIFAVIALALLLSLKALAVEGTTALPPEPHWGATIIELKRQHPYMLRSYAGLDARMRSRVQRYRNIETLFGIRCEALYDFIGHRLYQVEYNFQKPNDLTFKLASSELVKRYGAPLSSSSSTLPQGELFAERSLSDVAWKTHGLETGLRQIFSRFANGMVVRQLFITLRSSEVLHSDRRPLQLQSDAQIGKAGALVRIAFAGGLRPERLKAGASLERVRLLLEQADFAVATLDGTLAVPHGSSKDGAIYAVDNDGATLLESAGLDVISMAAPEAVKAGTDAALAGADALQRADLKVLGFGSGAYNAGDTLLLEAKGVRVALLSFYYGAEYEGCKLPQANGDPGAPLFAGSCEQAVKFRYDVAARVAAAASEADVIAVLFSWNAETDGCNSEGQNMLMDAAWNAGAHIVAGYTPGRLQVLRSIPGRVALTSCGDLTLAPGAPDALGSGLIFMVELNREGLVSYDLIPLQSLDDKGSPVKTDPINARRVTDELRSLEGHCNNRKHGGAQ